MKKRILSVALVVAMATTMFAGCGKKSDKEVKDAVSGIDVKAIDFKTSLLKQQESASQNYIQISQSNTLMLSQEMLTQKSY